MVSAGMTIIKYLLFIFNLIFWITGVAILAVGIYVHVNFKHFFVFVGSEFVTGPIVLIVVGSIVVVIAFFGCCGAVKESHCMITTFAVFLGIIFVLELTAGILGYVKRDDVETIVNKNMNAALTKYGQKNYPTITRGIDILQHDFKCCGFNNSDDWSDEGKVIPTSCCHEDKKDCVANGPIYTQGCYKKFMETAKSNLGVVGGIGVGIAFVQIVGIICACCLASEIKRKFEIV